MLLLLYYDVEYSNWYGEVLFDMLFVCIESILFLTSSSSTSMPCWGIMLCLEQELGSFGVLSCSEYILKVGRTWNRIMYVCILLILLLDRTIDMLIIDSRGTFPRVRRTSSQIARINQLYEAQQDESHQYSPTSCRPQGGNQTMLIVHSFVVVLSL